jgi:hypothetical protein
MLGIYVAIPRPVSWKLQLIASFGSRTELLIVFFTNAIKFGTRIRFS